MNMKYNVKLYTRTCGLTWDGVPVNVRKFELEGETVEDIMFQLLDKNSLYRVVKIEITESDINIIKKENHFYI